MKFEKSGIPNTQNVYFENGYGVMFEDYEKNNYKTLYCVGILTPSGGVHFDHKKCTEFLTEKQLLKFFKEVRKY